MPKIRASLADISTEYVLIPPASYRLQIKQVDENVKEDKNGNGQKIERVTYVVKSVIVEDLEGDTEHAGKPIYDYINIHTKEGELNNISLANLKRYAEAIVPEEANSDEFDTDSLVNGQFVADVYIDSYTPAGATEARQTNRIKPASITEDI